MTYLQLVNAVLRRLREDEVTTYKENSYSKLIGDFVNEAKREVEDAWNWIQLRTTIQVTCESGTFRYTLTDAGQRFRILQVYNDTQDTVMRKAPYEWMNNAFNGSNPSTGSPQLWDINGSSAGDPNVDVFPIPDTADVLNFNMVLPQDDLDSDGTSLEVPNWPVVLGAHAKALSERGEDGSTQFAEVMMNYNRALSDAIAIDSMHVPHELIWDID
jgi:hypothetical protein